MLDSLATPSSARQAETGFAAVLRERTKTVHREAERAGFVADMIRGRASREGYALFLRNLHPVYAALEPALAARAADPLLAPFADPRLHRLAALCSDLRALAGPGWADLHPVLPEALSYAAAIGAAGLPGLAAHAYARYLGDLSGGQILKPLLARTLGLGADTLAFYDFPALADPAEAKSGMRRALDRVPPEGDVAAVLADEAVSAFRHNIALSEAVGAAAQRLRR